MRYHAIPAAVVVVLLSCGLAQAQSGYGPYQYAQGSVVRLTALQEPTVEAAAQVVDPVAVPIPMEGKVEYDNASAAPGFASSEPASGDGQASCADGECGKVSCGRCGLGRLHALGNGSSCGENGCGGGLLGGGLLGGGLLGGGGLGLGCGGGSSAVASVIGNQQCGSNWFGGLYGLIFNRDDDNRGVVLGYDDTNLLSPGLSTGMARSENAGGFETRFGRMLGMNSAFEVVYWGIFPEPVTARLITGLIPGNAVSAISFAGLEYDNGSGAQPVDNYFQNTFMLEVRRDWEVNNVELNFLRLPFTLGGWGGKSRLAALAGVRYIKADDYLFFGTDRTGANFGDDPANELAYEVDVKNELVGFQVGGLFDYAFSCRLFGHVNSKFGLYGNRMGLCQHVNCATPATVASGPYTGQVYYLNSEKKDMAFVGELDAGLSYALRPCWRVSAGYRVVALSGIALSTSQIPSDFTDLASAADINNTDSLIMHGAYIGSEFAW